MPDPATRPRLIFGYGNPSRGDDALGPLLLQRLPQQGLAAQRVELLDDFQLQIEHALDLIGREWVLFVDASLQVEPPCRLLRIQPQQDQSFTTHALTPAALLHVYQQVQRRAPPACYLLAIRGYRFELGQPLSTAAEQNLEQALALVGRMLSEDDGGERSGSRDLDRYVST